MRCPEKYSLRSVSTERLRLRQYLAKRDNMPTQRLRQLSHRQRCLHDRSDVNLTLFAPKWFEKIRNTQFWCKKTGRNLERPKLGVSNFSEPLGCKKTGGDSEWPKLGILNVIKPFWYTEV